MEKDSLGFRISKIRKDRKLSQRQLAALVSVEPNTISMYEGGGRKPSTEVLIKIAKTLHVSTDYLLTGDVTNFIDVSGLEDQDISLLCQLAEILRSKHK